MKLKICIIITYVVNIFIKCNQIRRKGIPLKGSNVFKNIVIIT